MAEGLGWDQKHSDGDVDYRRFLPFLTSRSLCLLLTPTFGRRLFWWAKVTFVRMLPGYRIIGTITIKFVGALFLVRMNGSVDETQNQKFYSERKPFVSRRSPSSRRLRRAGFGRALAFVVRAARRIRDVLGSRAFAAWDAR